jgi:hypothetical protein
VRPCPWVGCRYHLYLDVSEVGGLKINYPWLEPWELPYSCALDLADASNHANGMTLENTGAAMNVTRERCRQIETPALAKANVALRALLPDLEPGDFANTRLTEDLAKLEDLEGRNVLEPRGPRDRMGTVPEPGLPDEVATSEDTSHPDPCPAPRAPSKGRNFQPASGRTSQPPGASPRHAEYPSIRSRLTDD